MFDAEIAATLLNRWDVRHASTGDHPPLELLQEGKLHFKRGGGDIRTEGPAGDRRLRVDCLTFADGSRALRVAEAEEHGWSRWTAAEPSRNSERSTRIEHAEIP